MSRALTFWTDANIKLIKENFICAAVPTWVARAKNPEGEFLRAAGIDKQWVTSSGYMSCVSASGKLLGHAPGAKVLEAFSKLPEEERKPGAVTVADLAASERVIPEPPQGGLVIKVHARFLARDGQGALRHATGEDFPLMGKDDKARKSWRLFLEPNTEYLWLTASEAKSLLPAEMKQGAGYPLPQQLAERLARFHFTPRRATTSEGGILSKRDIKTAAITLTVAEVTDDRLRLRVTGEIHTGSAFDAEKATTPNGPLSFGYKTPVHGVIEFDRKRQAFTRFDVVAPGEVWGRWGDANNNSLFAERPGASPFAFALELATLQSPTERIPPGGNPAYITRTDYFPAEP